MNILYTPQPQGSWQGMGIGDWRHTDMQAWHWGSLLSRGSGSSWKSYFLDGSAVIKARLASGLSLPFIHLPVYTPFSYAKGLPMTVLHNRLMPPLWVQFTSILYSFSLDVKEIFSHEGEVYCSLFERTSTCMTHMHACMHGHVYFGVLYSCIAMNLGRERNKTCPVHTTRLDVSWLGFLQLLF